MPKNVKAQFITKPHYGMKQKKHSEETLQKMSKSHQGPSKQVQCPKCSKIGGTHNMHRYHFDNCGKPQEMVACPHCGKQATINIIKRWHFDKCKRRVVIL